MEFYFSLIKACTIAVFSAILSQDYLTLNINFSVNIEPSSYSGDSN